MMNIRLLLTVIIFGTSLVIASAGELEEEFSSPPNTARLWVYWTCQDGHYSIKGTTADLGRLP